MISHSTVALTPLLSHFAVRRIISEEAPNPEWHEYFHLSHSDLKWTTHGTPRVDVTLTLEIRRLGWPAATLGTVQLSTTPNEAETGLLDLSHSSRHRLCRKLSSTCQEVDPENIATPVIELDVIIWSPGKSRPSRISDHPHKQILEQRSSGGLSVITVPPDQLRQITITQDVQCLITQDAHVIDPTRKWSIDASARSDIAEDTIYSGLMSPMCRVTLPPATRERLGIPLQTTHVCFSYPDSQECHWHGNSGCALGAMVLRGSFCYFEHKVARMKDRQSMLDQLLTGSVNTPASDEEEEYTITCIKPITHADRCDISFGSWAVLPDPVAQMIERARRHFNPVTLPILVANGFATFSWVSKSEVIDGNVFQYGGFIYTFHDGSKPVILQVAKVANTRKQGHVMSVDEGELNMVFSDDLPPAIIGVVVDEEKS